MSRRDRGAVAWGEIVRWLIVALAAAAIVIWWRNRQGG